jgi:hypothetical protein
MNTGRVPMNLFFSHHLQAALQVSANVLKFDHPVTYADATTPQYHSSDSRNRSSTNRCKQLAYPRELNHDQKLRMVVKVNAQQRCTLTVAYSACRVPFHDAYSAGIGPSSWLPATFLQAHACGLDTQTNALQRRPRPLAIEGLVSVES